jgi:hypothetical protein
MASYTNLIGNVSSGWYVGLAVLVTIGISGTKAAPIAAGIMTLAVFYQFDQWYVESHGGGYESNQPNTLTPSTTNPNNPSEGA